MFQLSILQDAIPSGGGYAVMVIALGAFSGAMVAVVQWLFYRLRERSDAASPSSESISSGGAMPAPRTIGRSG